MVYSRVYSSMCEDHQSIGIKCLHVCEYLNDNKGNSQLVSTWRNRGQEVTPWGVLSNSQGRMMLRFTSMLVKEKLIHIYGCRMNQVVL